MNENNSIFIFTDDIIDKFVENMIFSHYEGFYMKLKIRGLFNYIDQDLKNRFLKLEGYL